MKTEIIRENPIVCVQAEEVHDARNWRSVIVTGRAERLASNEDKSFAMFLVKERNPLLTPALHERRTGEGWREANAVIYRLRPARMTGLKTVE